MKKPRFGRWLLAAALPFSVPCMVAPVVADGTASPGKFAAAASQVYTGDPITPIILTAELTKGKRHRMLFISVTIAFEGFEGVPPGVDATVAIDVNGTDPTSTGFDDSARARCEISTSGIAGCLATYNGWMDLDAAEAANPGSVIGVPV